VIDFISFHSEGSSLGADDSKRPGFAVLWLQWVNYRSKGPGDLHGGERSVLTARHAGWGVSRTRNGCEGFGLDHVRMMSGSYFPNSEKKHLRQGVKRLVVTRRVNGRA
jgi:hypothetical protein